MARYSKRGFFFISGRLGALLDVSIRSRGGGREVKA
jgi:hypothetical protein